MPIKLEHYLFHDILPVDVVPYGIGVRNGCQFCKALVTNPSALPKWSLPVLIIRRPYRQPVAPVALY